MSHAISLDSLLNLPAMGIPVVNYSPESTWEFGAAAQGYFRLPNQTRTSILQVDGTYSLNRQWYINTQGTLYFGRKNHPTPPYTTLHHTTPHSWQLHFRLGYSNRPATYYGTGNRGNTDVGMLRTGTPYTLQRGYVTLQAPIAINKDWAVGPTADFLYAQYHTTQHYTTLHNTTPHYTTLQQYALGAVVQYDTRDIIFYPTRGLFFKAHLQADATHVYSTRLHATFSADLRHYIPLPHRWMIAWQMKTQWLISNESDPTRIYPLLPRLGGQDGLRGVNSDMFRDDVMMALQAELRIPLWSIFRATVFAGIGDVYDLHHWRWATPKVGYGMGIRATINKAKVNIRADIARSNIDPRWNNIHAYSFYLTATEAF